MKREIAGRRAFHPARTSAFPHSVLSSDSFYVSMTENSKNQYAARVGILIPRVIVIA